MYKYSYHWLFNFYLILVSCWISRLIHPAHWPTSTTILGKCFFEMWFRSADSHSQQPTQRRTSSRELQIWDSGPFPWVRGWPSVHSNGFAYTVCSSEYRYLILCQDHRSRQNTWMPAPNFFQCNCSSPQTAWTHDNSSWFLGWIWRGCATFFAWLPSRLGLIAIHGRLLYPLRFDISVCPSICLPVPGQVSGPWMITDCIWFLCLGWRRGYRSF